MAKGKQSGRDRSAITGQYVTKAEAQKDPKHTVHETVQKPKPAPKKGRK